MKKRLLFVMFFALVVCLSLHMVSAKETPNSIINIDFPEVNKNVVDKFTVGGWSMSEVSNTKLTVQVDSLEEQDIPSINRCKRSDVIKAIKGYGDETTNPTPGFSIELSAKELNLGYGSHIVTVRLYSENDENIASATKIMTMNPPASLINIDFPKVNGIAADDSLLVQGWVLSEEIDTTLKISLDGKNLQTVEGANRQQGSDVLRAIQGYGDSSTNPTPGFKLSLPINDLSYGQHYIEMILEKDGKTLTSLKRTFTKKAPASLINIDFPKVNGTAVDTLRVGGWALSESTNAKLTVKIDNGQEQEIPASNRCIRTDVLKAIQGYGDSSTNPTPGYNIYIPITNLDYNTIHTVTLTLYENGGSNKVLTTLSRTFTRKAPASLINIDFPKVNEAAVDNLRVGGWVLSEASKTKLMVRIDNNEEQEISSSNRKVRTDVLKAIQGYGDSSTNPTPGYDIYIPITNLDYNTMHTVTLTLYEDGGSNKVLTTLSRTFTRRGPKSIINIDFPKFNGIERNTLLVQGWVLSETNSTKVTVKIDNQEEQEFLPEERQVRADVLKVTQGYGDITTNPTPGFKKNINIEGLNYGSHKVTITMYEGDLKLASAETSFQITIPKTIINIDKPSMNQKISKDPVISGWILSEEKDIEVHVLAADKDLGVLTRNIKRSDVLKKIEGYGGEESNPTPGFSGTVSLEYLLDGKVTLTVDVRDKYGNSLCKANITAVLEKYDTKITINKPASNQIFKDLMDVAGSVETNAPVAMVEAEIDGVKVEGLDPNQLNYSFSEDVLELKDGTHTLKVIVKSDREELESKTINFIVKKEQSGGSVIDYTDVNVDTNITTYTVKNDKNLTLQGWSVSNDPKQLTDYSTQLKVYVDNKLVAQGNQIERFTRLDVLKKTNEDGSYTYDCGSDDMEVRKNVPIGYKVNIPNLADGVHTITLRAYNHLGEEIGAPYIANITLYSGYSIGIDVSEFNGQMSLENWKKAKANGVDFVILRAGYRGWDPAQSGWNNIHEDRYVRENIVNAYKAGLKVGLYYFSQATNALEGDIEATKLLGILDFEYDTSTATFYKNMIDTSIPIAIDVEWGDGNNHNGRADVISNSSRNIAVKGFVDRIHKAGYKAMIYASRSWIQDNKAAAAKNDKIPYLDLNYIKPDDIWVADWWLDENEASIIPKTWTPYKGAYSFWQHGVGGRGKIPNIPGIGGGDHDGNKVTDIDLDIRLK